MGDMIQLGGGDDPATVGPCVATVFVVRRKGPRKIEVRIVRQDEFPSGTEAKVWGQSVEASVVPKGGTAGTVYHSAGHVPPHHVIEANVKAALKASDRDS